MSHTAVCGNTQEPVVLAGIGNPYRRDDGVGPIVADLAANECAEFSYLGSFLHPLDLLDRLHSAQRAVLVDATRSGTPPGSIVEFEIGTVDHPSTAYRNFPEPSMLSSHGLSLLEVLSIARQLDKMPAHLVVVGIEGADFSEGYGLSEEVARSVPKAVDLVVSFAEGSSERARSLDSSHRYD